MPLEVIETHDPITDLALFRTSPVYEMIISLQTLLNPGRHSAWAESARAELPDQFMQELRLIYEPYVKGTFFFELAVDYPDHEDVPGFIEYVRHMDPVNFVFYLVGRILPRDEIARIGLDYDALLAAMEKTPYDAVCMCREVPFAAILNDISHFQNRLADLWQWYWDAYFSRQVEHLRPNWDKAIAEKSTFLARQGGMALYENVTGKTRLLDPLPPDHPITEVVFIPLRLLPGSVFMHYGYGNVTVLFDSERTEARQAEIQRHREQILTIFKALGDSSRLDIMRQIAQHEGTLHGKKIAAKLNLSPSAVSRHLSQLKDAGLILEESQDNRTITYRLNMEMLKALPEHLWETLYN